MQPRDLSEGGTGCKRNRVQSEQRIVKNAKGNKKGFQKLCLEQQDQWVEVVGVRETKLLSFCSASIFFSFLFFLVKEMASLIGQGRIKVKEENEAMTTDCEPETIKPAL